MNDNQLPLTPFFDRLFVLRDETLERTKSGVIIPDGDKERPNRGIVIATGPDCKFAFKGQHIIFGQHHGFELQIGTEEITVLREQDIYAGEEKKSKLSPEERALLLDDIISDGNAKSASQISHGVFPKNISVKEAIALKDAATKK